MRPQVGQLINNKYRLIRLIGDGGMGSVYEARHEVLGTTVALKFLHPELSKRAGLVQRFLQEARVSAQIKSDQVVRVSDVDQTQEGLAFLVMEFVEGRTLQALYEELYRTNQRLLYRDALGYALQMLDGVQAAHDASVVHRDLKPDNVMIAAGPKGDVLVKLLDFGIAKLKVSGELQKGLTRPGVIMGTPEYMAPEQAFSADRVDARADVFSLGVIIFEMLAGRRPVGGDDPHVIAQAYLEGRTAKIRELAPHVPEEVAAVVEKAIAPRPDDRWPSALAFREALLPFAEAVDAIKRSPGAESRPVASAPPPNVEPPAAERALLAGAASEVAPARAVARTAGDEGLAEPVPPTADQPFSPAGSTAVGAGPGTASMRGGLRAAPAPRGGRRARRGTSWPLVLLAGAAVAGMVMLVVYFIDQARSTRTAGPTRNTASQPQPPPTTVVVQADPKPQQLPVQPQPPQPTPPPPQPPKTQVVGPKLPTVGPLPSLPPLVIPSEIQLPFPLPGAPQPDPPPRPTGRPRPIDP